MRREIACRWCRIAIPATHRSGACERCRRRHCRTCAARLPEGKRWPYCQACARENRARTALVPGRRCSTCRARLPMGRADAYCSGCQSARLKAQRAERATRAGRTCAGCGDPLPVGKPKSRCAPCDRERREALSGQIGRRCSFCRAVRPAQGQAYCAPCNAMVCAWRRARLRGDPTAVLLGKPRPWPKNAAPSR